MDKYSDVLLWALKTARKGKFKKNEIILIRFDLAALKMCEILQGKLLEMGMNPVLRLGLTHKMEHNFYAKANRKQLVFLGPGEKELCEDINGSIYLHAPESLTHLRDIDPKKIGKAIVAKKPLREILQTREKKGIYGWTLCTLPTEELARQAKISLRQYTNQIIRACYLDKPDPVHAWKTIYKNAIAIKKWINSMEVEYYHIKSENTDLNAEDYTRRKAKVDRDIRSQHPEF